MLCTLAVLAGGDYECHESAWIRERPDIIEGCPKLNGIQWNPETTPGTPTDCIEMLREIRRRGMCLYVTCEVDQAVAVTRELGPDGLCLRLPVFDSVDEAERAVQEIDKAC